jgi:hypothetical protein
MSDTKNHEDRRRFVRRAGLAALAAPALPWLACVPEPGDGRERRRASTAVRREIPAGPPLTRPVLLARGTDAVELQAPPLELPVAYVSMAERRVYVDFQYRDQVYWDLRAHISVSTGLWRLPLVGDPPRHPVMPGDVEREFEEFAMRDWDPTVAAAEGDIRIVRGEVLARRVEFSCAPLPGWRAWIAGGPWEVLQCGSPGDSLCREDFFAVGTGVRHGERECAYPVAPVRVLTWAVREGAGGEGS